MKKVEFKIVKYIQLLRRNNTLEDEVEHLKAEIYDLNKRLEYEKSRVIIDKKTMSIIKNLPTATKRKLGLLNVKRY